MKKLQPYQISIRRLRKHNSIRAISKKTGVSRRSIRRILEGETKNPTRKTKSRITKAARKFGRERTEYSHNINIIFNKDLKANFVKWVNLYNTVKVRTVRRGMWQVEYVVHDLSTGNDSSVIFAGDAFSSGDINGSFMGLFSKMVRQAIWETGLHTSTGEAEIHAKRILLSLVR